ncbi:MAG: glycoside hydrolase family 1 protein [Bacteroidetes bacterium]|nr:glycoside hydrolase family 1 protein [Bacteroidota bacterium]
MEYVFPPDFIFGTSTAAAQIETAHNHDWQGIVSTDGHVFNRTTDHEQRLKEDAELIASLAPYYRMGPMWSKLQQAPLAELNPHAVNEYKKFLDDLQSRGVKIMMVLHHFTNPIWFAKRGGWEDEKNIYLWIDFVNKTVDAFGSYVSYWNTFNEPNVYASYGWITGLFPPFKKNPVKVVRVVKNLGKAHNLAYDSIKEKFPHQPVGISHNSVVFTAENILGWFPAQLSDYWFMEWIPRHFEKIDFFGMSYYARLSYDPLPITYIDSPEKIKKLGRPHDDMWESTTPRGCAPASIGIGRNIKNRLSLLKMGFAINRICCGKKPLKTTL